MGFHLPHPLREYIAPLGIFFTVILAPLFIACSEKPVRFISDDQEPPPSEDMPSRDQSAN